MASTFGERLRHARTKAGLTQEELAEGSKVSLRLLQKYEADDSTPSVKTAARLAEFLNTTTDYLAGSVPDSSPYLQDDLTVVERLVVLLMRRRQLPGAVEQSLLKAIEDELRKPRGTDEETQENR